jgi:hypothetical protein
MHELHCPLCNIILCRGLQVNYFPSFHMLSAIKHAAIDKIHMSFAAGNGPIAVKLRAMNSSIVLKMSQY